MKITLSVSFFMILFSAFLYQPAYVFSSTTHMDSQGNTIDKAAYERIASEREMALGIKLKNGYEIKSNVWKDPIKLRQKRIEQWKKMRSLYDPNSLPSKIENPKAN